MPVGRYKCGEPGPQLTERYDEVWHTLDFICRNPQSGIYFNFQSITSVGLLYEQYTDNQTAGLVLGDLNGKIQQNLVIGWNSSLTITNTSFSGMETIFYIFLKIVPVPFESLPPILSDSWLRPLAFVLGNLEMSHCRIPRFRVDEFCGLIGLYRLDLSDNRLNSSEDIGVMCNPDDSSCHHCLPILSHLDISFNRFSDLNVDFGVGLPILTVLIVASSNVSTLISSFNLSDPGSCPLFNLRHLKLQDNSLSYIPEILFKCTSNLESLDISGNRLIQNGLQTAHVKPFPSLKLLNLSGNKLDDFPDLSAYGRRLEQLDLSRNNICSLSGPAFPLKLTFLMTLSLAYNNITSVILESLCDLINLREIDLRANGISSFVRPKTLCEIKPLTKVHLDDNKLRLDELFNAFDPSLGTQFQEVHLSNNLFEYFPEYIYRTLKDFRLLDLSRNHISYLSDIAVGNVHTLDVRSNRLQTIHKKELELRYSKNYNVIPRIYLEGNPLQCNCDVEWLADINFNK